MCWLFCIVVVFQPRSHVRLFVTPWTAARQAPLSFTVSHSLLKLMSTESMMLSVSSSAKTPENPNWKLSVLQVLVVIPINSNDSQSLKYEDDIPKSKRFYQLLLPLTWDGEKKNQKKFSMLSGKVKVSLVETGFLYRKEAVAMQWIPAFARAC